jgi:hypothetical protein
LEKDSSVDASVKSAKFLALDKILGLNLQSH